MVILPVHQGTPEWGSARTKYYRTASRAPTVMGANKYESRNDLLRELKTGVAREIDANTQALFDAGHAAEDAARKIVEGHLKAPLLPLTCLTDDEYLLASFDGINEEKRAGWEHKLWNESLAAQVRAKELEPHYYWQLEHQALVGELEYIIFTCSDGTPAKCVHLKYVPVPGRAEALLAGWKQFDADLTNYQHVEVIPAATATQVMALPALSIQVNGAITLTDNLAVFGEKLTAFIERLPKAPATDQEFADAEQAIKTLETAQNALEAAESSALAQVASVDEMRRTVALYAGQARSTRLMLTKLVAARKDAIRAEILGAGRDAFIAHVEGLNKRLQKPYMPVMVADFATAIKGLKTVSSIRNAVDTELARAKIAANETADRIQLNLIVLREANQYHFLFADAAQIVLKAPDDLAVLVKVRIAEHQQAEQKRLDADRERIRQEEQAKAEAEARAKVEAEQRAQRDQAEAKERQDRADKEAENKRIEAELAAEEARLQDERRRKAEAQQAEAERLAVAKRAADAERQKALDTDQLITALYERIRADKKYAGITKAISTYLAKVERQAA